MALSRRPEPALFARLLRTLAEVPRAARWILPLILWCAGWLLLQTTELTGSPPQDALSAAFAAVKLFTLDPPGFPVDPWSPRGGLLWLVIIGAPILTATAAADFVRRHVLSAAVLARGFSGHVVVCGMGHHGRVIADAARDAGYDVVAIDLDQSPHGQVSIGEPGKQALLVVHGDMTDTAALLAAGVDRADRVFLSSGDPLINLQAAGAIAPLLAPYNTPFHVLVDEPDAVEPFLQAMGVGSDRLIDQFEEAAKSLVAADDVKAGLVRIRAEEAPARIALVGFGRFGQAVLRELRCHPELARLPNLIVEVVDPAGRAREVRARRLAARPDTRLAWRIDCREMDAECWVEDLAGREPTDTPALVIFCLDNDSVSLRCGAIARWVCVGDVVVALRLARALNGDDSGNYVVLHVAEPFRRRIQQLIGRDGEPEADTGTERVSH